MRCEYCHEDADGYVKPMEKNCHAYIRFGLDGWTMRIKANRWEGDTKINFCPMCGRKLDAPPVRSALPLRYYIDEIKEVIYGAMLDLDCEDFDSLAKCASECFAEQE